MNCPHIPELKYSEFGTRLKDAIGGKRYPLSGSIEITNRCNLRCQHCFIQCDRATWENDPELTTAELCGILDQIADAGTLWLLITGGEPLMRPDFTEIYLHAKRRGFLITLFTNGTLVTDEIADLLAAYPPFAVEVSLYGRTAEVYERVTTVPGSFERCMAGIRRLHERKLLLRLKTPVMTLNVGELWDIKAYAEELGVPFRFDPMINAGMVGGRDPIALRLSPEEVVALDMADPKRMAEWREFCEKFVGERVPTDDLYVCGAGVRTFHVDAAGRMSVCLLSRRPGYDARVGSFAQGWAEALPRERGRKVSGNYRCNACPLQNLCGQCAAWVDMESGDAEKAVPFLCEVAHLRAEASGLEAEYIQTHSSRAGESGFADWPYPVTVQEGARDVGTQDVH